MRDKKNASQKYPKQLDSTAKNPHPLSRFLAKFFSGNEIAQQSLRWALSTLHLTAKQQQARDRRASNFDSEMAVSGAPGRSRRNSWAATFKSLFSKWAFVCFVAMPSYTWAAFPATPSSPVGSCTGVASCYGYTGSYYILGQVFPTIPAACTAAMTQAFNQSGGAGYHDWGFTVVYPTAYNPFCSFTGYSSNNVFNPNIGGTSLQPVGSATYSCPDKSTLNGSTCTCNTGYVEGVLKKSCVPAAGSTTLDILHATKSPCVGQCTAGNPIYPLLGSKSQPIETGFSIGGQGLTLTFDTVKQFAAAASGLTAKTFGNMPSFGGLWESSLHKNIKFSNGGFGAVLFRGNGHTVSFKFNASTSLYVGDADVNDSFVVLPGGYRYVNAATKSVETYNLMGQLILVADARGNVLTYSYSSSSGVGSPAAGYLMKISDNVGRAISFQYILPSGGNAATDGLVSVMSNSSGQTIAATYDTSLNLQSLTWPDGKVQTFLYENSTFPWALTGVVDERGIRFSTFSYDAQGQAVSTEHAGGVDKFSVSYTYPPLINVVQTYDATTQVTARSYDWQPAVNAILTKPNGDTAGISSLAVLGYPLATGYSQSAGSGGGASNNASTYDAAGNLLSRDDFQGQRVCYVYDASNREVVRVEGLATTVDCTTVTPTNAVLPTGARKITTTWHPDWRLPVKTTKPGSISTSVYQGQPDPFNSNIAANCISAVALPNGKVLPKVCKEVTQATLANGNVDTSVPSVASTFTYDAAGRILTAQDTLNHSTTYSYYADSVMDGNTLPLPDQPISLLVHADGANGSTTVIDSGAVPKTVTVMGGAKISTTQSKFGGSSLLFASSADAMSVPASSDFQFGSGDFTAEAWIYPSGTIYFTGHVMGQWLQTGQFSWHIGVDVSNTVIFETSTAGAYESSRSKKSAVGLVTPNAWNHIALTRQGNVFNLWVNGALAVTLTDAVSLFPSTAPMMIGAASGQTQPFTGYIDEIRIIKGAAKYTAAFTPTTIAFADPSNYLPNASSIGHTVGDLQSITNAAGHVTQYTQYDRAGRVRQMIDPKGVVTDISYTPRGWVSTVSTTAPGGSARVTTYSYDNVGQLTGVAQPDGTTLSYSYDAAHRLVGVTDAKGNSVTYTLDNVGNRIAEEIKDPTGVLQRSINRSFDALNRVQQVTGSQH